MEKTLKRLVRDFPELTFVAGGQFRWSPQEKQIMYLEASDEEMSVWALLHEVGHALLAHQTYGADAELLLMETAAWQKARELAIAYDCVIDDDHIQDCLDTYRDWLYQRSTCPECGNNSLQHSPEEYRCFNCRTTWRVSSSRFCRPYRQTNRHKKQRSPAPMEQTTFA